MTSKTAATAEPESEEVKALRHSISGHKGHLSRALKAVDQYVKALGKTPNPLTADLLKEELSKVAVQLQRISDRYDELVYLDRNLRDEQTTVLDGLQASYTNMTMTAHSILHTVFPPPVTAAAPVAAEAPAAAAPRTKWKPLAELRPEKLAHDSSSADVRTFFRALETYFDSDDVSTAPVKKQHGFFLGCLDKKLQAIMEEALDINPNMAVFGAAGCVDKLQEHFDKKHPLFNRQLAFFRHLQAHGQTWSDAARDLRRKADFTDLAHVTKDDLLVFGYIRMTTDTKLRDKLTTCGAGERPTVQEILDGADKYEANQTMSKEADKTNQAKKAHEKGTGGGGKKNSGGKGKGGGGGGMTKQRLIDEGRCFRCGSQNHITGDCPKKDTLQCNKCKKNGHSAFVCTGGAVGKGKGKGGGKSQPGSRAQSRAGSRDSSPVRDDQQKAATVRLCPVVSKSEAPPLLELHLRRGKRSFSFQAYPDTGATRTIIALNVLQRHHVSLSSDKSEELVTANGGRMVCEGSVVLQATYNGGPEASINAVVSSDLKDEILLGWPDLKRLELVPCGFPCRAATVSINTEEALKTDFDDVFGDELGRKRMKGPPMKIHLRSDKRFAPTKVLTCSKIPLHLEGVVEEEMKRLLKDTIAPVPAGTPTQSICRTKFLEKVDEQGNIRGVRLVTDFSPINQFIERPVHPFPSSQDILKGLDPGSRFFAKLDAVQGYFQIPLDEES